MKVTRVPLTILVAVGAWLTAVSTTQGQCGLPAANCAGTLHCGGEWDFENGFYFTSHYLAGQCGSPPGGGNQSCVPSNKAAQVGAGWSHWASFPTWATPGYWGVCSFNANQNCANVLRGNNSQELTMTCANGVGVIYKTASVPAGHQIQVEAFMKFTPNGDTWPDVEHAIGIDPAGGTNPASANVQWTVWQQQAPSPPQPASVFNRGTAEAVSQGSTITVFIRQRAFEPPCMGQTFMIDNVKIYDLGVPGPALNVSPLSLSQSAVIGIQPPDQTLNIKNVGANTLTYSVTDDAVWLSVSPAQGSSSGETDALTASYDVTGLNVGSHQATVTVDAGSAGNSPQVVNVTLLITTKPGDHDNDGDVDLNDYGRFQTCYSGGGAQAGPGCGDSDFDGDNDVDAGDFAAFMACVSGEFVPSDPLCVQ